MVNARISSLTPSAKIRNKTPNSWLSNFQTGHAGEPNTPTIIPAGSPIGLLMALTYAAAVTISFPVTTPYGPRPNVRIQSY